jgi:hypothetical protein
MTPLIPIAIIALAAVTMVGLIIAKVIALAMGAGRSSTASGRANDDNGTGFLIKNPTPVSDAQPFPVPFAQNIAPQDSDTQTVAPQDSGAQSPGPIELEAPDPASLAPDAPNPAFPELEAPDIAAPDLSAPNFPTPDFGIPDAGGGFGGGDIGGGGCSSPDPGST